MGTTTLCTGLSDFHKMVVTVMKSSFEKMSPKEISYRNYRNLDNSVFKLEYVKFYLTMFDHTNPLKKSF